MDFEIDSIQRNQTWELVEVPIGNVPSQQNGYSR